MFRSAQGVAIGLALTVAITAAILTDSLLMKIAALSAAVATWWALGYWARLTR